MNLSRPVREFFCCQRQCGGTSDSLTVQDYHQNTEALRVVNSFSRGPVRGNCRGSESQVSSVDCAPIAKWQSSWKKLNQIHRFEGHDHSFNQCF